MAFFVAKQPCLTKLLYVLPTGEFSLDDSKRLCVLTLEKALKQLPEGQDTVLGIFDLRGFKQRNGDLGFAGFLVSGISPAMTVYNNCMYCITAKYKCPSADMLMGLGADHSF